MLATGATEQAAALERTSLKDFVLRNALLAAEAVIEKAGIARQ